MKTGQQKINPLHTGNLDSKSSLRQSGQQEQNFHRQFSKTFHSEISGQQEGKPSTQIWTSRKVTKSKTLHTDLDSKENNRDSPQANLHTEIGQQGKPHRELSSTRDS
jgi:hypothetical protein